MPTFNFKINQFFFLRTDKRSSEVPEGRFLLFTAENILKKKKFITKLSARDADAGDFMSRYVRKRF